MNASTKVSPAQFMVGDHSLACDWRWPHGHPIWRMSSKEGVEWLDNGPLTEQGRTLILEHFGLDTIADQFPLEVLQETSPANLAAKRQELEKKQKLPHLEVVSTRIGGHVPAATAA